jgi:3-oxocholest-4-en-26-oyl-CoA dehydrogenase alpha subunit
VRTTVVPRMLELRLDAEQRAFRDEVRSFLAEEMRTASAHRDLSDLTGLSAEFEAAHHRRAGARGFLGIAAPTELGGGGKPASFRAIYSFEAARVDAPSIDTAMVLCGAPLLAFGTAEQKQRLVPPMIRGEVLACVAYTEADAGSDLSAIRTQAVTDKDSFVLTGTKVLVTGGHKSQWCLTVARTDANAPTREALTMFVVALDTPGVQVRRRTTANGWTLSEIDFDHVVLDQQAVLGTVGQGWRQMTAALVDERSGAAWLGWATRIIGDLGAWVAGRDPGDPATHHAVATVVALHTDLAIGYRLAERVLTAQDEGRPQGADAAASKVWATELLQRTARAALDVVGIEALQWTPLFSDAPPDAPLGGRIAWEYLERIHPTISVGANELQRDSIARAAFAGLGAK